jgi:putative FmdB family regulatory protein
MTRRATVGSRLDTVPSEPYERCVPTYEYVCSECKNAWEEIQKISEAPVEICPKCGKPSAKRQISGGTFILKGGGWYADAYSSPKAPKASASESGGSSEAKSETKSESTSATTSTESAPKAASPKAETTTKSDSGTKPAA